MSDHKCPQCGETDPSQFVKGDRRCKVCLRKKSQKYKHSKKGWLSFLYANLRKNNNKRGFGYMEFSKEELADFIFKKNKKKFKKLWKKYKKSGWLRDFAPSIDRLDDEVGYRLDNIQLVAFRENYMKAHKQRKECTNSVFKDQYTPVKQYDLNGNLVATYPSIAMASRATKIWQQNILKACQGKRNTAGGFIWEFDNDKA